MKKLGYVYNRTAASLRTQRSHAIGLAITDITNPFFAELAVSIETHSDKANYAILLTNTSEKLEKQDRFLEMMQEYHVDGLLLCPAQGTSPDTIDRLHRWKLPFVLIARYLQGKHVDYVGADNIAGAEMAVEHLISLGHQRIAFLGGPSDSSARKDRETGYRNVLQRHNLEVDPRLSHPSLVTREGGYAAIQTVLQQTDPPTAALCYNDVVALGAMLGLQAGGVQPGNDFSLVGFDNIADSVLWTPALTTVSIPPRLIGEAAVKLLLERISDPAGTPRNVSLSPTLVIRESSGRRE